VRVMVLTDRKRIVVTEAEEKKIVPALERPGERITVKGIPYKKTMIAYFDDPRFEEIQGVQAVMDIFPGAKQINDGLKLKCRAQYSIQCEINNLCQSMSKKKSEQNPEGLPWQKLVADKKWREMMRSALWEQADKWCDDKKQTCACEDNYQPSPFQPHKDLIGSTA
jgi:hypothetical protein